MIHNLTEDTIGVVLPEGFKHAMIKSNNELWYYYPKASKNQLILDYKQLPPGRWEIVGESGNMDEEGAEGIVAHDLYFMAGWSAKMFCDYEKEGEDATDYTLDTALESFHSLRRYHKIETNHLIIKNIN